MQNVKNASAKKSNTSKTKIEKINLSQFAEKLKGVELKVKEKKATLYQYPDNFNAADINSEKGKKHRNSLRTKLKRFSNNIFVYAKIKDADKLKNEVKDFDAFYKLNFQLNDYSVRSITNSKENESNISLMLTIIKEVKK